MHLLYIQYNIEPFSEKAQRALLETRGPPRGPSQLIIDFHKSVSHKICAAHSLLNQLVL